MGRQDLLNFGIIYYRWAKRVRWRWNLRAQRAERRRERKEAEQSAFRAITLRADCIHGWDPRGRKVSPWVCWVARQRHPQSPHSDWLAGLFCLSASFSTCRWRFLTPPRPSISPPFHSRHYPALQSNRPYTYIAIPDTAPSTCKHVAMQCKYTKSMYTTPTYTRTHAQSYTYRLKNVFFRISYFFFFLSFSVVFFNCLFIKSLHKNIKC